MEKLRKIRRVCAPEILRRPLACNNAGLVAAKALLEKRGLEKTYWGKALIAMGRRKHITRGEYKRAKNWQTCACGKQDARITRLHRGAPQDDELRHHGVKFFVKVGGGDILGAVRALINIENRAAQILKEQAPKE